jgi:hypothetical protein
VEGKRWSLERAARIIIITDELRVFWRRRRSVARASSLGRRAARRSRRDDAVSIDTRLSTSVRRDTKTTLGCHADLWTSEVFPPSPKRRARKKRGRLESGKKRLSRGDPGGARSKRRDRARSPVLGRERGVDTRRAGLEEARRARTAGGRRESATLCNETLREKTPREEEFRLAREWAKNVDDPAPASFLVRERNKIQTKLAQVLSAVVVAFGPSQGLINTLARTDTHERTMASTADAWCFAVDARFERNGVMSSTTLKCVRLRRVANPRPARRHPELGPRVFESPEAGRSRRGARGPALSFPSPSGSRSDPIAIETSSPSPPLATRARRLFPSTLPRPAPSGFSDLARSPLDPRFEQTPRA